MYYFIRPLFLIAFSMLLVACGGSENNNDNNSEDKNYSSLGSFESQRYPEAGLSPDNYVVYYPKDNITASMPVVVFLEGGGSKTKINKYRGVMEFMATQGYFVIGAESGGSYDSDYALSIVEKAIMTAIDAHGLNISKLSVMGHSQGGGQAFHVMRKLQKGGYGSEASLTLSIDGWFAFSMNKADLNALQGDVAFIQMNNNEGTGTDPRIHLTIWDLASSSSSKKFFILPANNHGYVAGDLNNVLAKTDLLFLLGALLDDSFTGKETAYTKIPAENKTSYEAVKATLKMKDQYTADCKGVKYSARETQLGKNDINYCMNP